MTRFVPTEEVTEMAIVKTLTASNGVTVRIHDDAMLRPGTVEYEAAKRRQCQAAYEILIRSASDKEVTTV